MLKFISKRIIISILIALFTTTLCYVVINLMPGDIITYELGPANKTDKGQYLRHQLGLDKPVAQRYIDWLVNIVSGDLGTSFEADEPVFDIIRKSLPFTIFLAGSAFLTAMMISIIIGIITAVKRNSKTDYILSIVSLVGMSIPEIWIGSMLAYLFSLKGELLPFVGKNVHTYNLDFIGIIKISLLPFLILTTGYLGQSVRYVRSSVQEVLSEQYIMVAKSKGVGKYNLLLRHTLKNAAKPIITFGANTLPTLISSTVIVEAIFGTPGMGQYLLYSCRSRDYALLMGIIVVTMISVIVANLTRGYFICVC